MDSNEHNSPEATRLDRVAAPTGEARLWAGEPDDNQIIIVSEPPKPLASLPPGAAAALAEIIRDYLDHHGLRDPSATRATAMMEPSTDVQR